MCLSKPARLACSIFLVSKREAPLCSGASAHPHTHQLTSWTTLSSPFLPWARYCPMFLISEASLTV